MPPVVIGAVLVAGAAAGAIAGSMKDKASSSATQRVDAGDATQIEKDAGMRQRGAFDSYYDYTQAGPGQEDVGKAYGSSQDLAKMYQDYSKTGGLPGSEDITNANNYATNIFAPQQTGLNQAFQDQNSQAQRLAAQMGRSVDDPVLQAQMRLGQIREQNMLNSQKTAFGSQMALQLPQNRLNLAGQGNNILQGLASQAFTNQSNLIGLGSNIINQERNMRLATATRTAEQYGESGGGLKGALAGGVAGLGSAASAVSSFGGMGGGGGMGAPQGQSSGYPGVPGMPGAGIPGAMGMSTTPYLSMPSSFQTMPASYQIGSGGRNLFNA